MSVAPRNDVLARLCPIPLLAAIACAPAAGRDGSPDALTDALTDDDDDDDDDDEVGASSEGGEGDAGSDDDAGASGSTGPDPGSTSGVTATGDTTMGEPEPVTYTRIELGFDDLGSGEVVTDQYAEYGTVSSSPGCAFEVTSAAGAAASDPYFLFAYYSCETGASAPFYVDFAAPVQAPTITLVGVNSTAAVATVRVLADDGAVLDEMDAIGLGSPNSPVVVTFDAATEVMRLEVVDVGDAYGLGFDDLAFDFPER